MVKIKTGLIIFLSFGVFIRSYSQIKPDGNLNTKLEQQVLKLMEEGHIPGLSLVIVNQGKEVIKTFGYANVRRAEQVTPNTLFELGSCSKAFTALAVQKLAKAGHLRLDAWVSDYIPWFRVKYKDSLVKISILQLLHHTSGIPWQTISLIPESHSDTALEQTVRAISGISLHNLPGKKYEYATVDYDILALIIQQVTHEPFEYYIQKNVLQDLQLYHTTLGKPADSNWIATGYKIGFFKARAYKAPQYRGNYASGYVISNAEDIGLWLRFQMGLIPSGMYDLALLTHQRDETVPLHDMSSYAMGWDVSLNGNHELSHDGLNPNYTSYMAFRPDKGLGIAVLANSNSSYTSVIGNRAMKLLSGEKIEGEINPDDGGDKGFSLISIILGTYILGILGFLIHLLADIGKEKREYEGLTIAKMRKFSFSLLVSLPFLYGLYLLPKALAGFTWESIIVWTPVSFEVMIVLILLASGLSYLAYLGSLLFPEKDKFRKAAPRIVLMSILSGLSNMVMIILVTSALDTGIELSYLAFYYTMAIAVYLLGRRYVQVNLIRFARGLIYELRIKLIDKIFSTSYQKFEKIDRGRVYTALNDDVDTIGNSTNMLVMLVTGIITVAGAFLYLAAIAFWATALTVLLIISLAAIYYFVSRSTNVYYNEARDTRDVFMRLINGMIDGFKEISLHKKKKAAFKEDVGGTADEYRRKISFADIRFVNAFLVGESLLVILLGLVAFGIQKIFPGIALHIVMKFVIVLLYLIAPINDILNAVPGVMQLKIAWKRVQVFLNAIPANLDPKVSSAPIDREVESIRASGVAFRYLHDNGQDEFTIGPIDLEVRKGEILFIIGGNGSGKTTLAKLLAGLYEPETGKVLINGKPVDRDELGELFSVVFNPAYLFEKLYNIDVSNRGPEVKKYLQLLDLEEKVQIAENKYSTIHLSGGQRKRLALLQCYLEDSPIYLFDEWAADQDPEYRNFFYRTLLPEMKMRGKIVIAITHDDHYFDVADKVLKMNQGKLEDYSREYQFDDAGLKF